MKKRDFTLCELLVILVTGVLLVGVLTPLVRAEQKEARNTGCLDKLRQYGTAVAGYAADNQEWMISDNAYSTEAERGINHLRNNYDGGKARSGRIVLLRNGYFGEKLVLRNGGEQLAARRRFYQCPDDTKVFNNQRDSYYLLYYTPNWCSFSYRFGSKDYAREKRNGAGHPGGLIAADAGICEADGKNGLVIHEEYTNALALDGRAGERPTALAIQQPSILKALRYGDGYGCLDMRE